MLQSSCLDDSRSKPRAEEARLWDRCSSQCALPSLMIAGPDWNTSYCRTDSSDLTLPNWPQLHITWTGTLNGSSEQLSCQCKYLLEWILKESYIIFPQETVPGSYVVYLQFDETQSSTENRNEILQDESKWQYTWERAKVYGLHDWTIYRYLKPQ